MLTKSSPNSQQQSLFHSELFNQLDTKDPLIQLVVLLTGKPLMMHSPSTTVLITADLQNPFALW